VSDSVEKRFEPDIYIHTKIVKTQVYKVRQESNETGAFFFI